MKATFLLPVAALALTAAASPALAKGGDDNRVTKAGSCGSGATSKLKLKADDGAIEAEFEVDRNRSGERWRVTFSRDGHVVAKAHPRTHGRSGSFSVERRLSDPSGADRITARGTGPTGLTCTATATLPEAGASAVAAKSAPANCITVVPQNSGVVDKPASGKPVTVDLQVTNCGTRSGTFTTRLVGTTNSLRSYDPYMVEQCPTAPYSAPSLTLKPGESRDLSAAATVGYCKDSPWGTSPWGIDATYSVDYAVTVLADGAPAGTTTSTVLHRGGN